MAGIVYRWKTIELFRHTSCATNEGGRLCYIEGVGDLSGVVPFGHCWCIGVVHCCERSLAPRLEVSYRSQDDVGGLGGGRRSLHWRRKIM
jgi:hypothetical protein